MERNREARRGTTANGGGLSRRRPRNSSSIRDSLEASDGGGIEMLEASRVRDRASRRMDQEHRERGSRSSRRRVLLHGSSRDEVEDSSEEMSLDDQDEDDEDDALCSPPNPAPQQQNQHHRKSFPAKALVWKVADEMIGVSIPRRARSSSVKRSPECWATGGGGELIQSQQQQSTSPSSQISPFPSSRKKMKPSSGTTKQRPPPKITKSTNSIQEIEIEVAEVLYGMTRQIPYRQDQADTNGSGNESIVSSPNSMSPTPPSKQSVILPPSNLSSNVHFPSNLSCNTHLPSTAPKRKCPRPVKFEDEIPRSPGSLLAVPNSTTVSSAATVETEKLTQSKAPSPKSDDEQILCCVPYAPSSAKQELGKSENNLVPDLKALASESDGPETMGGDVPASPKKPLQTHLGVNLDKETAQKIVPVVDDGLGEGKFCIDLMALPGKSSPERDGLCDFVIDHHKSLGQDNNELASKKDGPKQERGEELEMTSKQNAGEVLIEDRKPEKPKREQFDSNKNMVKDRALDLQLEFDKPPDNNAIGRNKHQLQKQQHKPDNAALAASLTSPMAAGNWPGTFPPFGYMGQFPSLQGAVPIDNGTGSSNSTSSFVSPSVRPKRCATHCYIAQNIMYHQRIARMNPFWPTAAGTSPLLGAKAYNLNVMPHSESALLGNSMQGSYPVRNLGTLQDTKGAQVVASFPAHPAKDTLSAPNSASVEAVQKKQLLLQPTPQPQPTSASSILHGPAFIIPLNQQQAAAATAAAAVAAAATRSGAAKTTHGVGNAIPSPSSSNSVVAKSVAGGTAANMNYGYTTLPPTDAQYLAILQNNGYPFPIPAHIGAPPPYRNGAPAQTMPFYNGSFYSSQMLHPAQFQLHSKQQQQQQMVAVASQLSPHAQQGNQNSSASSGSSSSQKQPQQLPGSGSGGARTSSLSLSTKKQQQRSQLQTHNAPQLQTHHGQQLESETGREDSPSTADSSRIPQAQMSLYGHNLGLPIHPSSIALMSSAAASAALGSTHNEKQSVQQQQQHSTMKMELTPSQAFAMSFASFNGGTAPPGLDFSSMALYPSLPEMARHGYHPIAPGTAATAAAVAAQHKKSHLQVTEDGKSATEASMNANIAIEEERKTVGATSKVMNISSSQHSLAYSQHPPVLVDSIVDGSSQANGTRNSNRSSNAVAVAPTTTASMANVTFQQFQKQHQMQPKHQVTSSRTKPASVLSNNVNAYSECMPSGSSMNKFPQTLSSFPRGLIQGGSGSLVQSPQWKSSDRTGAPPGPSPSPDPLAMKHLIQQQSRIMQQSVQSLCHQSQISFGVNSVKTAAPAGAQDQLGGGNVTPSGSSVVGSPSNSASKSTGGSPRACTSAKPAPAGQAATASPHPQQPAAAGKNSSSSSSRKSSPNRNAPSILGQPHIGPAPNSGSSQQNLSQTQMQYRMQQKQPSPQLLQKAAHLMFSNAYVQAQPPPQQQLSAAAAAAAAGYYQRRQSEQQQRPQQPQQNSNQVSSGGMLGMCSSTSGLTATILDPGSAKSTAGNSIKGMPPAGLMHAAQLAAAAAQSAAASGVGAAAPPHPAVIMSASFPYMSSIPPPAKPSSDPKPPAAGNNVNLHPCRQQPEKR